MGGFRGMGRRSAGQGDGKEEASVGGWQEGGLSRRIRRRRAG